MDLIVVSLTTIDSRLDILKPVIQSILGQTLKPHVIHVFYSEEPFQYDQGIPANIIQAFQQDIDLINVTPYTRVLFTKTPNIGSYRKLIPSLKLYPQAIIITIDDDHEHAPNFIQSYIDVYNTHHCIVCSGGKHIDLIDHERNQDANLQVYLNPTTIPIMHILPEGFGGILYHTNMFTPEFIHYDYSQLPDRALKNDDMFFRLYTFRRNIPVYSINVDKNHLLNNQKHVSLFQAYNQNLSIPTTLKNHFGTSVFPRATSNLRHNHV